MAARTCGRYGTCRRTCGLNSCSLSAVSESGESFGESLSASGACIGRMACLGTCGFYSRRVALVMAESRNGFCSCRLAACAGEEFRTCSGTAGLYLPHQLSGGQLQRVVIARAVSIRPKVLLLDEATSALDVSVQRHVLELLNRLKKEFSLTYVFIGHDLAVVRSIADRIVVMYSGLVVEEMNSCDLENAVHPYTRRLLQSDFSVNDRNRKVIPLEDMSVSGENQQIPGCPFAPRCPSALPECAVSCPLLKEVKGRHLAACLALE